MDKLISQQAAIDKIKKRLYETALNNVGIKQNVDETLVDVAENRLENWFNELPSAQPTLYGYNIEHLELIARVLQKENLPPERVVEALTDIGRIVAIVRDEFEETLRKAVEDATNRCG